MDPLTCDSLDCEGRVGDPPADQRADREGEATQRLAWLVSTIEAEIIPRLMLAHRAPERDPRATAARPSPDAAEVEAFADMVMGSATTTARAHVDALRCDGASLEDIYLKLLAPAARHLGELWTADRIDFTEVTAALWRLQQLMYDLSPAFHGEGDLALRPRRALLAPVPGSQHTFGLLMVAEFFQRAGWDVWTEPCVSLPTLLDATRSAWFDIVGLSVGSVCHLDAVSKVVQAVRERSLNPRVGVMVGGPLFLGHPELVAQVGADATADDAAQAVAQAQCLVDGLRAEKRRAHS